MSLVIVASMVISLIVVALPGRPTPTPTPWPTRTPIPRPTKTATVAPTTSSTPSPTPSLVSPTTEPVMGPVLPSDTPAVEPTPSPTPAAAVPDIIFAVCGDSRSGPSTYQRVLEAVMADGSEFLIHTGDLVNVGLESQWQDFQEVMAGFALPFYPVPGNHDGLDGELDGYLQYSGAPAAHYSFDREKVHFALADSHHGGITASELAWLREDLSATGQPVKIVTLHHPPFDPDGTDYVMAFGNETFMSLMVEQEVDYVFAGHIHAYARAERDGVIYVITGGAGAPLYSQDHPQAFNHYLRVTVHDEEVSVEVVRI
jgi:predicted phosphodiesterase